MRYHVKAMRLDGTTLKDGVAFMESEEFEEWYLHFIECHGMEDKGGFIAVLGILEDKKKITFKDNDDMAYKVSQID